MKIASFEAITLKVPEDDPLANMPEEAGRKRPDRDRCACAPTAASRASASRSMAAA